MDRLRDQGNLNRARAASDVRQLAGSADVDAVFSSMARMLKRSVGSSWTAVYLIDRDGHGFTKPRTYTLPERLTTALQTIPLLAGKKLQLRQRLIRSKHLLLPEPATATLLAPELRRLLAPFSLLALPMLVQQKLQGVVLLARPRRRGPFPPHDLATARELVSQAALVAGFLRLSEESLDLSIDMAKRIDTILTLDEINKSISSSLSHDRIIATAAGRIEGLAPCDLQVIAVMRQETLQVMSIRGEDQIMTDRLSPGQRLDNEGIIALTGAAAEIRQVADLRDEQQSCPLCRELAAAGIRSLLAVPLVTAEGVQGLLLLADRQAGFFPADELFAIEKIASQLGVALENARLYEDARQLFFSTVTSLANAIDAKSPWTKGHSERVMNIAANIARDLGFDDEAVERVRLGGLLHDIGKIGVMEALLEKPAELDDEEFPPIRLHPEKGVAILAPITQLQGVLPSILHHHECFDGSGYPHGLSGEAIPLDARIIAVADSFDAMVAERPYKKGLKVAEAAEELIRCAGSQFDPMIVDCFCARLRHLLKNPAEAD